MPLNEDAVVGNGPYQIDAVVEPIPPPRSGISFVYHPSTPDGMFGENLRAEPGRSENTAAVLVNFNNHCQFNYICHMIYHYNHAI